MAPPTRMDRPGHRLPTAPRSRLCLVAAVALLGTAACDTGMGPSASCGPYPDWRSSPYVLPYSVGTSYTISQGNCSSGGHRPGFFGYSYDWGMPIGTLITAIHGGEVAVVRDHFTDQTTAFEEGNYLVIDHGDGTFGQYGHLTQNGALVAVGDVVGAGDPIARSGNSGFTGGFPHLHLHVSTCVDCASIPFTFRNTRPNPRGLQQGEPYPAQPF